jgi:DNA mismatch repair protein MutS
MSNSDEIETTELLKIYFNYHEEYSKKYVNDNVLILIQVGKFYEAYGTDTIGQDLLKIQNLINVMRTVMNKKKQNIDKSNPYKLGFPMVSIYKFLEMLVEKYTVVLVDQIDDDNKNISISSKLKKGKNRDVVGIYSRGTFINNIEQKGDKFITSIYISEEKQRNNLESLICCGISCVDLSTGKLFLHESQSTHNDKNFSFDETLRLLNSIDSKEIIIYYNKNNNKNSKYTHNDILSYFNIDNNICRFYDNINNKYLKISFQNELLKKIYPNNKSYVEPIDFLNLEDKINSTISLCLLADYIYDKNNELLKNLSLPNFYLDNTHLILGNNALQQLNILTNKHTDSDIEYKSLFDVVNKTSTPMGERYLKSILTSPFTNKNEIEEIYNYTENMLENKFYLKIAKVLNSIRDIEKMERQIGLKILKPIELNLFMNSYLSIIELTDLIEKNKNKNMLEKIIPNIDIKNKINKLIKKITDTFDIDELSKCVNIDFKTSPVYLFKENISEEYDLIRDQIDNGEELMNDIKKYFLSILNTKNGIEVKNNKNDKYFLKLSHLKAQLIKSKLENIEYITIGKKKIMTNTIIFQMEEKSSKIKFSFSKESSDGMKNLLVKLEKITKTMFNDFLFSIYVDFKNLFDECNKFVSFIDYLKSSSVCVVEYNYCRPIIETSEHSYVNAKQLRHPIIERLIDCPYIPNDIDINKDNSILLFGLNSSGKSILMKSIGVSVIMAQSGLFVPAQSFILSPYKSLYTRITANDDMLKGLSSFTLEMLEIISIRKRANKNTMVIGDEICRGTDHISGTAIVAEVIIDLVENEASFIFTSHLHDLCKLDEIKNLKKLKICHLKVEIDEVNSKLIYDRKLLDGSGSSCYGLLVAQFLINDTKFIDRANSIKNKLLNKEQSIINGKKSKYNKDVYVHECFICHSQNIKSHVSNLETHHINFQKDCVNDFSIEQPHINKNHKSNLIVLCNECHDKVHNNKLKIAGFVQTSKGKDIKLK